MEYTELNNGVKMPTFGLGNYNETYKDFFSKKSFINSLTRAGEPEFSLINVTFEPGCRNNWHIHHAKSGGGQILLCVDGEGWYQEWPAGADTPTEARALKPGDVVTIPANVKHWHGAKKDSWFSHVAIEVPGTETSNEWLEPSADPAQ